MWGGGDGARSVAIPSHMSDAPNVQLPSLTGEWDIGPPAGHHPYMDGAIEPLLAVLITAVCSAANRKMTARCRRCLVAN
jgi:hypothetical protein